MTKGKFSISLCTLAIAVGFGGASPKAADEDDCRSSPLDAVMMLPSPLRKWGQIACTPFGHVVGSRDGWVWASLEDAKRVLIPSQIAGHKPEPIGNESYFTAIHASEIQPDEFGFALAIFEDGLDLKEASQKVYRAELTSVSGRINTIYFFDFGSFAGGMWCPDDDCIPESRFLIMEQEHKTNPQSPSI